MSCLAWNWTGVIGNIVSAVINEALRRTSAMCMSAERRQQRFYEGGQDYLERRRESARLSRAGGVAAAADSEDGPVGEDQVHMVPSLLRIGTSDGASTTPPTVLWRRTTRARIRSCLGCLGLHYAKLKCGVHRT